MKEKHVVKDCLKAMLDNYNKEVTMKCRIGLDNKTSYDFFKDFIDSTIQSGIKIVYVHARDAMLVGLNPKENRTIPPLKYEFVSQIKKDFPNIQFIINGGINSLDQAYELCNEYDGVMVGRLIQSNPFCLLNVDQIFFDQYKKKQEYKSIILEYFNYIKQKIDQDSIYRLLSPLLYVFLAFLMEKNLKPIYMKKWKIMKSTNWKQCFYNLLINFLLKI